MKKNILIILITFVQPCWSQEVLHLTKGSSVNVQSGSSIYLQGGVGLENGSLLNNNGSLWLKNNSLANQSNWLDNSLNGALTGNGLIIFNSNFSQQFIGATHFNKLRINTAGLLLNSQMIVDGELQLYNGKITTGNNLLYLANANASSLVNDASNNGYINSWVYGNLRRKIISNTSSYDFPVGDVTKANLLQFINNNLTGTGYLTASFGPKQGTDAGLFAYDNGTIYNAVNNSGVWYLTPNTNPTSGNYALQIYFNGFTGLLDNQFGILRRPDASMNGADWVVPGGSLLEPLNGLGRKLSDGFARRKNISSFSQFGIGMMNNIGCDVCTPVCTYTQGFYSNPKAAGCYYASLNPTTINSGSIMLNAFGSSTYQVFGNVANRQFFTLFKSDITNGNIFKMLPGFGNSLPLGADNILPFTGALYADNSTWYLVPIETNGPQKGKIKNLLLSQLITLWFNLRTSNNLGSVDLSNDTLVTMQQSSCGSGIPVGSALKYGIPHNVIMYLNSTATYTHDVSGLFQLANDVLGGVTTAVAASEVQAAVTRINEAFDGCRILVGTIQYSNGSELMTTILPPTQKVSNEQQLIAVAFPNPFQKQFSLKIISPVSGPALIDLYSANGSKLHSQSHYLQSNISTIIPIAGNYDGVVIYRITIGQYKASGIVVGPN